MTPDSPSFPPALDASGIEIRIGYRPLLRGVTLGLAAGETCVLAGPNGCGKTTLLRVLAGLVRPTAGEVRVFGERIWPTRACSFEHGSCYLGAAPALLLDLDADSNLEFAARAFGVATESSARRAALARVGLEGRALQQARTLSTGQKRRLSLASLVLIRPRLLLADEPTNGLDAEGSALCLSLFDELVREHQAACIVASHDPAVFAWSARHVQVPDFAPRPRTPQGRTPQGRTQGKKEIPG